MKSWHNVAIDGAISGLVGALAVCGAVAFSGRRDSGSAIAPFNATSHVIWGNEAASVERVTLRHTLPGVAINLGAAVWWALVFQKLFGRTVDRGGAWAALAGGTTTAVLAYAVDYHLVPERLTPGWEKRLSNQSVLLSMGVMGIGLGLGAIIARKRG